MALSQIMLLLVFNIGVYLRIRGIMHAHHRDLQRMQSTMDTITVDSVHAALQPSHGHAAATPASDELQAAEHPLQSQPALPHDTSLTNSFGDDILDLNDSFEGFRHPHPSRPCSR